MVKIIANGAEYDVSSAVRQDIYKQLSSDENEKNIVFIVPDQFEFETEKVVYKDLVEQNLLTRYNEIQIETFSSLSEKILAESGEKRIPADDTIKNILMHKAVLEQKNALCALSRQVDKPGFCQKILTTISMLNAAGMSASKLDANTIRSNAEENKSLKSHLPCVEKLCDVSKIQKSYDVMMSGYLDRVDAIGEAAAFIASNKNSMFENTSVFVDCFNDFTGNQLYFLMKLTEKAKNITFGFTVDSNKNSREKLFFSLNNQIDKIIDYAKECGNEIVVKDSDIPRKIPQNSPLSELSEKIFGSVKSSVSLGESCELVHAADTYDEIDYTAAKIKELCLDKGYLYRDIAVLCTDSTYSKSIKQTFDKYEIPYFIDVPEPILYQPLVNFFLALLNVLREFSVDSVLSLIKTNFMSKVIQVTEEVVEDGKKKKVVKDKKISLSKTDIDNFESYIFEWDLHTKHLKKPFDYADNDSVSQMIAESVRKAVVEPLLVLKNKLNGADGAEITRLIYYYAADVVGIERVMYGRCLIQNSSEIDTELLRFNQQLWNTMAEILDTLERELNGINITLDEYYRIFADICSATTLAKPPQYQDCVIVGDVDRTRAQGIKATFILGASYENFPTVNEGAGIFSEVETDFIRDNISEFGIENTNSFALKSTREQYCLSLYRAYRAVTLASERLTLISHDFNAKGDNVQKSLVVNEILSIFPNTSFIETSKLDDSFFCRSLKSAKQRYAKKFAENSQDNVVLKRALTKLNCGDYVEKLENIRSKKTVEKLNHPEKIGCHKLLSKNAKRLFSDSVGATAVEKLNLCKFNYFCSFGLNIREKTQRVFNRGNRGNAIHFVLQKALEEYCTKMDAFFKLTRNDFTAMSVFYLNEYIKEETNGDFEEDARTKFLFLNIANSAADVLITLQAEFSAREYRPKFFELDLSKTKQEKIIDENESSPKEPPETELSAEETKESDAQDAENTDFTINIQPLVLTLDDGSTVKISGRVDRVDIFFSQDKKCYVRIVDYKSSAKSFEIEKAEKGINIQMLLYLFALCDANAPKKNDTVGDVKDNTEEDAFQVLPGGISYLPSKNLGAVKDKMAVFRLLAFNHNQSGLYVSDDNTNTETQKYYDFIAKKIFEEEEKNNNPLDDKAKDNIKKALALNAENTPNPAEFQILRENCEELLKNNFKELFNGNIDALPLKYQEKKIKLDGSMSKTDYKLPCKYCRFRLICGNDEERVIDIP